MRNPGAFIAVAIFVAFDGDHIQVYVEGGFSNHTHADVCAGYDEL